MEETVICDMNPNQPVRIGIDKCLTAHSTATRTEIMDRKTGRTREYKPCLKCPTALELKEKLKVKLTNHEPISTSSSPEASPETTKPAPKAEVVEKGRVCKECQEDKFILGRGLCGSCYRKLKKRGQLEKYPAKPFPAKKQNPAGPISKSKPVVEGFKSVSEVMKENQPVSFLLDRIETVPGLMEFLRGRMKEDMRESLETQILWELRNSMRLYAQA